MKAIYFAHTITAEPGGAQKVKLVPVSGSAPDFEVDGGLPDLIIIAKNTFVAGQDYTLDISPVTPPPAESEETADTQGDAAGAGTGDTTGLGGTGSEETGTDQTDSGEGAGNEQTSAGPVSEGDSNIGSTATEPIGGVGSNTEPTGGASPADNKEAADMGDGFIRTN
jgi:hypothetical protein